jgi:putative tryptophan/tyrosine transport system substrate-binding protein
MRRRDLMKAIAGSAVSWPLAARTQQSGRIRRVGVLTGRAEDAESLTWVETFRQRLKELGWSDGGNIQINLLADGDVQRWPANAGKMVASAPDVIIVVGNPGVEALQRETPTIPIVFVLVGDPVGSGFVGNLAHPGGNITGFMHFEPAMGAKWLETLKAIAPAMTRALVLHLPEVKANVEFVRSAQDAGPIFNVAVRAAGVHNKDDIEQAMTAFSGEPNVGLIILPNPISGTHRALVAELAIRHRLPTIAAFRNVVASGVLASYGIDISSIYRRAAEYTDRILKGEKPSNLPVQAPTKYELIINLKTAGAIGLEVPPSLLSRADEVIE